MTASLVHFIAEVETRGSWWVLPGLLPDRGSLRISRARPVTKPPGAAPTWDGGWRRGFEGLKLREGPLGCGFKGCGFKEAREKRLLSWLFFLWVALTL